MRTLSLPAGQMINYVLTGKFEAPSDDWTHENFYLTEYELFVITEGTLYLTYNHENFIVSSGQYLLLPPCNAWRHGFKPSYCAFYWLHFSINQPTSHDKNSFLLIPQTGTVPKPEKMVVLMKQLQDSVKNHYPATTIDAMATCVITELYGQLSQQLSVNDLLPAQRQIYSDIADYIQHHITENIRVADIAGHLGYNSKYLSHLFAKMTGGSLKQFIMNQKIDTANFLLTDTNQSVAAIAKTLGFTDSHNFSRAYKRTTGLTPREYRNAFSKRLKL